MENYIEIRKKLSKYISIFVMVLIILQPMLDVLSYWLTKANNTSITTLLRTHRPSKPKLEHREQLGKHTSTQS